VSGWTKERNAILQEQVKATGVRALVVEGEDDQMVVEALLEKIAPGRWATSWCAPRTRKRHTNKLKHC